MKSIKIKFFAAICAIAIAFVGILSIISLTFYDNYYLWQREKALTDVYIQLCSANNKGDEEFINEIIYSEDTEGVRVSVISKNGTVIYDSTMNEQLTGIEKTGETLFYGLKIAQNAVNEADKQKIAATGMDFVNVYDKARAEEFLCLVGILDSTGNYIIARIPFTYLEQNSSFNLLFLGISGGLTLIICIILAFIIARHFTNPLIEIADVANAMAEMDFSKKYEGTRTASNMMIERYNQSVLNAVRDVAVNGTRLQTLNDEREMQAERVEATRFTQRAAEAAYQRGLTSRLQATEARLPVLAEEMSLLMLDSRRVIQSIQLMKSLGGGYQAAPVVEKK